MAIERTPKKELNNALVLDAFSRKRFRIEEVFDLDFREKQLLHYASTRVIVGLLPKFHDLFRNGIPESPSRSQIDSAREWLASGFNKGEGRTTLLALCALEYAVEYPGMRVDAFDHYTGDTGAASLRVALVDLIDYHPTFKRQVTWHGQTSFTFSALRKDTKIP
jgi:hypothetical protein